MSDLGETFEPTQVPPKQPGDNVILIKGPRLSIAEAEYQFGEFIRSHGLNPPMVRANAGFQRFHTTGNKSKKNGWYVLSHFDGYAFGSADCWAQDGKTVKWTPDYGQELTPAEKAEENQKRQEHSQMVNQVEQAKHAEAAHMAQEIWDASGPVSADHPYLIEKCIDPTKTLKAILIDALSSLIGYPPQSDGEPMQGQIIVVPYKSPDGNLSTLGFIDEQGRKYWLTGGKRKSTFWTANQLPTGTDQDVIILIGEGVATVLSAMVATGYHAIAAGDCHQLLSVAQTMRDEFPDDTIIILADIGNGQKDAEKAAASIGGPVAIPDFGDSRTDKQTDFNDLATSHGLDTVKQQIEASMNQPAGQPTQSVELVRASDIVPEAINWKWDGWIAGSKIHILAGMAGTGKTTIALSLAATITTGGTWPDGSFAKAGNVVIWSGEDDPKDTLVPRLIFAGADMDRVFLIGNILGPNGETRPFDPAMDILPLQQKIKDVGEVSMLIIDPIVSAVSGDSHKNAEVRRDLQPLVDLGLNTQCAILGITHITKGTAGQEPLERVTGSLAFGALARLVLLAAKRREIPEGQGGRLFLRAKSNIGPDDGGFVYDTTLGELSNHPGVHTSAIQWGNAIEGSPRDLMRQAEVATSDGDKDKSSALSEAKEFLEDLLGNGPLKAKEIKKDADEAGHSWATVKRAKKELGIRPKKTGGSFTQKNGKTKITSYWSWALPDYEWPIPDEDELAI